MMNANLFSKLYFTLKSGKDLILIRIVRRKGSAPRGVGSTCIVDSDGRLSGSIGGGLLEHRAIQQANILLDSKTTSLSTFTMTAKEISDEGMMCGGSVEIYLEPILAEDRGAVNFFKKIDELSRSGVKGTLITQVNDASDAMAPDKRMLVKQDGNAFGTIPFMEFPGHVTKPRLIQQKEAGGHFFLEPILSRPTLLLFGGGHISSFVSPIAKTLGFHVTIFDDRSEFANRDRFPEADEIVSMPYQAAFKEITMTESSFIVIMTRGHGGDRVILELVLKSGKSPAYIGMIGSIRKRDRIYKSLLENGIPPKALSEVHSPIGLDIGAHTPEEIAVSIMAEIIQVRATMG